MKVCLDACVLYPTVMRDILIGVARAGYFRPVWSARILEEWVRATARFGPVAEMQSRGASATLRAAFPAAMTPPHPGIEERLHLPDPNDLHVLATAIAASADILLTLNARDFPGAYLRGEGVTRRDPDGFLWECWSHAPEEVAEIVATVHAEAGNRDGQLRDLRAFLKRARLPKLGKALAS